MPEHYDLMLLALFAMLVVLGLILLGRYFTRRRAARPVYEAVPQLLSDSQRALLEVLEQSLGEDHRVLCLVPLAELVQVRSRLGKGQRQQAQQAIEAERVDFVICRRVELAVAAVVEVDDLGRAPAGRKQRDALVGLALEQAEIPLIRLPAQGAYAVSELKGRLDRVLRPSRGLFGPGGEPGEDEWRIGQVRGAYEDGSEEWLMDEEPKPSRRAARPLGGDPVPPAVKAVPAGGPSPAPANTGRPHCPACGSEMVRRRVTEGKNAGTIFWGCSGFPECRKVVPVEKNQAENR